MLTLIDSSSWTHVIRRKGTPAIRDRVAHLLRERDAAWCDIVRLELWRGVGGEEDRAVLLKLEANVRLLPITDKIWQSACDLASHARRKGLAIPANDFLVYACATAHHAKLEANDKHYAAIARIVDA